MLPNYLNFAFNWNISIANLFSCKLYFYLNYSLSSISPMLLAYISMERFFSMKYPIRKTFLRKTSIQLIFLILIITLNLCLYLPIPILVDIIQLNQSLNETFLNCNFKVKKYQDLINYIDLANRAILPFIYIFIFTCLLLRNIFAIRKKICKIFLSELNVSFKREIRLAITSVLLNLIYILLQLPISIVALFPNDYSDLFYMFIYYLFYTSYSINFYAILFSNKLFHNEFIKLF